jgi:divalent metal cation (Fe/Co/Zn/Cd) transporter
VSTNAVSAPPSSTSRGARSGLVRRAKVLSWLSVAWMTIEAGASIVAALVAGSVALLGFGLDSLIELASASVVIWRFTGDRIQSDAADRRAQQLIAGCFAVLGVYLVYDGLTTLVGGPHPTVSWVGVAVSTGAIIVMPGLARSKNRVAAQLGSGAVSGDAAQSWLCAIGAAGVLVSILANAALGWWWLDPIIGLGIAGLAVHECREAWAGEVCADCAPVGFEASDASSCERCTP